MLTQLRLGDANKNGTCIISEIDNLNVFGIDWMYLFDVWDCRISQICNKINTDNAEDIVNNIQQKFPSIFYQNLGLCNKMKARLSIKHDA